MRDAAARMDFDPAELSALVADQLGAHAGSHWPLVVPAEEIPLAERVAHAKRKVRTLPVWALAVERKPYGHTFVDDAARVAVEASLRDGTFLELEKHPEGWLSSGAWLARLDALGDPERWIALGLAHESAGAIVHANAAFAAARWLDPHAGGDVVERVLAERPAPLPDLVADQPTRGFFERKLGARHHAAWRMGKLGRANLPSLLRYESDPSFWVRARIYRSLGQVLDLAALEALHEGTLDPHPFARAQAVRSLGWLGDPTLAAYLSDMAEADVDAEVRRSARLAVQRIRGFWLYFGEWNEIAGRVERIVELAWELVRAGLGACAYDVVDRLATPHSGPGAVHPSIPPGERASLVMDTQTSLRAHLSDPRLEVLRHELRPHALDHDPENPRTSYYAWQGEALGVEAAPGHEPSVEEARSLAHEPGKSGWNARRVLRRHGVGTLSERRLHALEP